MNILIVKLGALGDVINTLPLAVCIKNRLKARIHWLVAPLSYPIVVRHPCVDKVILFDQGRLSDSMTDVLRHLRSQRFDITLDLQRILKSGLLCLAAKSVRRIGFDRRRCKEMTWLFPFERIPRSRPTAHMVRQYLEFAKYLGIEDENVQWAMPASSGRPAEVPENYMVLNIGATKPANRWTAEGFAQLAAAVRKRFALPSILTGGKEDREMARRITAISREKIIDLVGRTSINELQDILQYAKAVVTCDTGPMHLAVALGKEVVALFGPSDPGRTGPFKGQVIRKAFQCSPCNLKKCRDPKCMKAIAYEDVMERLERIPM